MNKHPASDESESDGSDDEDDYSWARVWGMPDEVSPQAETWHSENPQVAIVTDSIQRSCDDQLNDFEDLGPSEVA